MNSVLKLFIDPAAFPAPPAAAGMPPYIVDLKAFMDARYGVNNWTGRTGAGVGSDAGAAMLDAVSYLRTNYSFGTLLIPPGNWLMNTAPDWSGIKVQGHGSNLFWNSNSGSPFRFSGMSGLAGGGLHDLAITLEDGYPSSTAQGVSLMGDSVHQPDQMMFSNLYITALGSSYWFDGMYINGSARASPQGVRVGDITNAQIFRCRNTGFYGSNMVQWTGRNIGCYVGTPGGLTFYMTGGGVHLDFSLVNAALSVSGVSNCRINGTAY